MAWASCSTSSSRRSFSGWRMTPPKASFRRPGRFMFGTSSRSKQRVGRGHHPRADRDGLPPHLRVADARRGDEDEPLDPLGLVDGHLGGDEAAHGVADEGAGLDPQRRAEVLEQLPVAGDRDLAVGGHRARPETGEIQRHRPVAAVGHRRHVLEPVLPAAAEAVDEDDRRTLADLGVVDPLGADLDRVEMLPPVDPHPGRLGLGVAVRIGPVGGGDVHRLDPLVGVGDGARRALAFARGAHDRGG